MSTSPLARWHDFAAVLARILLAIALGIAVQGVHADEAAPGAQMQFESGPAIAAVFQALTSAFKQSIVDPQSGVRLIMWMFAIIVATRAIQFGVSDKDLPWLMAELIKTSALASVAMAAITPQPFAVPFLGANMTLGEYIHSAFRSLSGLGGNEVGAALQKWSDLIFKMMSVKVLPADFASMSMVAQVTFVLGNFLALVGSLLFLIASVVALAIAAALAVANVFVGKLLMDLAVAMAPVLVPFIMFKPMNFLFDAWLKSLLIGGMTLVVGKFFLAGGEKFITTVQSMMNIQAQSYSAGSVMIAFGGVFLATLIFVILAMKLDSFARTLISGSGVSGISLSDFRQAVGGVQSAARAAGAGASGVAAGARGAAAANAARSSVNAASAAYTERTGKAMSTMDKIRSGMAASAAYKQSSRAGSGAQNATVKAHEAGLKRAMLGVPKAPASAPAPKPAPMEPLPNLPKE